MTRTQADRRLARLSKQLEGLEDALRASDCGRDMVGRGSRTVQGLVAEAGDMLDRARRTLAPAPRA